MSNEFKEYLADDMLNSGNIYTLYNHVKKDVYEPEILENKKDIIFNTVLIGISALGTALSLTFGLPFAIAGGAFIFGIPAIKRLAHIINRRAGLKESFANFEGTLLEYEASPENGRGRK